MSDSENQRTKNVKSEGVPVQAYIPREVYTHFKARYPQRGAITKLIRQAFLAALEEDEETAERARKGGGALPTRQPSDGSNGEAEASQEDG